MNDGPVAGARVAVADSVPNLNAGSHREPLVQRLLIDGVSDQLRDRHASGLGAFVVHTMEGPWVTMAGSLTQRLGLWSGAGVTTIGELRVSADGRPFRLASLDTYSSVAPVGLRFTASLGGRTIYSVERSVGGNAGIPVTIARPEPGTLIDALIVRLTNPALPCCSNPAAVDNILVSFGPSAATAR